MLIPSWQAICVFVHVQLPFGDAKSRVLQNAMTVKRVHGVQLADANIVIETLALNIRFPA